MPTDCSLRRKLGSLACQKAHFFNSLLIAEVYCNDVIILVSIILAGVGEVSIASSLILKVGIESSLIRHSQMGVKCALILARAFRVSEAVDLAKEVFEKHGYDITQDAIVLFNRLTKASDRRELTLVAKFYEWRSDRFISDGQDSLAASDSYNAGNIYRQMQDNSSALTAYRRAARLEPKYCDRDYWWRELASVCFGAGFYGVSSRLYRRAVTLNSGNDWLPLLADALMFHGHYKEAEDYFEQYLDSSPQSAAEWKLKFFVLSNIRQMIKAVTAR